MAVLIGMSLSILLAVGVILPIMGALTEDECQFSDCDLPAPNYLSYKYIDRAYIPPTLWVTDYYVHCTDGRDLEITKDKYESLYWLAEEPT